MSERTRLERLYLASTTHWKNKPPSDPLEKLDKKYIWHPFTQMQDWEKEPQIIIESGKGSTLTDVQGKTLSRRRVLALGHGPRPPEKGD